MSYLLTLKIALRALLRHKMRSTLTSLGIIIGIASVIAMVSIGQGARSQIETQIAGLGENIITVFPGSNNAGGVRSGAGSAATLLPEDAEAIALEIPGVVAVSPEQRSRRQVIANGLNWNTSVIGAGAHYPEIRNWRVGTGTFFTEDEVRGLDNVAVVGSTLVRELFPEGNAIGERIRIGSASYLIVGVLAPKGFNLFGQDQDDTVIVPYTSFMRRINRQNHLSSILIQAADRSLLSEIPAWVTDLLQYRHGLDGSAEADFRVRTQEDLVARATETTRTMTTLLAGVAGISLLVGGIGIMNIMLVSVTERTREIGIRLSVGAHTADVLRQFLVEAMIASSAGGLLGVLLGVGISHGLASFQGWPIDISAPVVLTALAFSAAIGIAFGIFPAMRAARLDPIQALRAD